MKNSRKDIILTSKKQSNLLFLLQKIRGFRKFLDYCLFTKNSIYERNSIIILVCIFDTFTFAKAKVWDFRSRLYPNQDLDNLCVRPTIDYLQAIVFLKEILKYFLCIFDTFTFAKAKVWDLSTTLSYASLRSRWRIRGIDLLNILTWIFLLILISK